MKIKVTVHVKKLNTKLENAEKVRTVASILCLPITLPLFMIEVFADIINDEDPDYAFMDIALLPETSNEEYELSGEILEESFKKKPNVERARDAMIKLDHTRKSSLKRRDELLEKAYLKHKAEESSGGRWTKWVNAKLCNVVEVGIEKVSTSCCRGKKYTPTYELEKRLEKLKK